MQEVVLSGEWQSLNALIGVAIGEALYMQNVSSANIHIYEGSKPDPSVRGFLITTIYRGLNASCSIQTGSKEIWVKSTGIASGVLTVQQVTV